MLLSPCVTKAIQWPTLRVDFHKNEKDWCVRPHAEAILVPQPVAKKSQSHTLSRLRITTVKWHLDPESDLTVSRPQRGVVLNMCCQTIKNHVFKNSLLFSYSCPIFFHLAHPNPPLPQSIPLHFLCPWVLYSCSFTCPFLLFPPLSSLFPSPLVTVTVFFCLFVCF